MIAWVRTLLFGLVFYPGSIPFVLATPLTALIGRRALFANVRAWAYFHRGAAWLLLGIRSRFEGAVPTEPVFYAAKHHSMYETLELILHLGDPATVMKAELARIPGWGWAARRYGVIVVDRDGSARMLRQMMREARAALNAGRSVLIFPEGTRVAQGVSPPLKSGFAGLYRILNLPVVPIAHDSGRVWPRKGPMRAGIVTFRFGEPIPPQQSREAIEARVHAEINRLG